MARNVFISFRFNDGEKYKKELAELFDESEDTVDFSEDEDRSDMSDEMIRQFLYAKLRRSSVTIVLITPKAVDYKINTRYNSATGRWESYYDDWIYDEVRYSLEDRKDNATNGLIGVYLPEAKPFLMTEKIHYCDICKQSYSINNITPRQNLVTQNMLNIKPEYKRHKCIGVFDGDYDSYCSLIPYETFKDNFAYYVDIAYRKRNELKKYTLCKRLVP